MASQPAPTLSPVVIPDAHAARGRAGSHGATGAGGEVEAAAGFRLSATLSLRPE